MSSIVVIQEKIEIGQSFSLGPAARQALQEFSPRPGMIVTVSDSSGNSFRGRIVELSDERAVLFAFESLGGPAESRLSITLLQALPERERMELIIQKATELGADVIVPLKSEHSISLPEADAKQRKSHRWQDHALAAARQCRRGRVPLIAPYVELDRALPYAEQCDLRLVLWEGEKSRSLREVLREHKTASSAAVLVGPEGGWAKGEIDMLMDKGYITVTMGRRILRTETAAIAAVALIQYELGDLG